VEGGAGISASEAVEEDSAAEVVVAEEV
jgi:hypothetical protein